MKLLKMTCPDCGADLQVNSDLQRAVCNYCGKDFMIDDEAKRMKLSVEDPHLVGYAFERGRAAAMDAGADGRILSSLSDLLNSLDRVEALEQERSRLVVQRTPVEQKVEKYSTFPMNAIPFLSVACMLIVIIQMFRLSDAFILLRVLFFMTGLALTFLTFRASRFYIRHEKDAASESLMEINGAIGEKDDRISEERNAEDYSLIPEAYQNREAIGYIYTVMLNRRSNTIQQAINLYEEKLHKDRLEGLQREQLELQRQNLALQEQIQRDLEDRGDQSLRLQRKNIKEMQRLRKKLPQTIVKEKETGSSILAEAAAAVVVGAIINKIKDDIL